MLKLIADVGTEPLTLAEAKLHCKVEHEDDDPLIAMLIVTSRKVVERLTLNAFGTQIWEYYLDEFPCWTTYSIRYSDGINMPKPPLQSVTSIKYIDDLGVERTLAITDYQVDTVSMPGRIAPSFGLSWPVARAQSNSVVIRFVAGHAALQEDVKDYMLVDIATRYRLREKIDVANLAVMPGRFIEGLLDRYRVFAVG